MIELSDFLLSDLICLFISGFLFDPVETMRGFLWIAFYLALIFFIALAYSMFTDYIFNDYWKN